MNTQVKAHTFAPLDVSLIASDPWHGFKVPDLTGIEPARYYMIVMQLGITEKIGSIFVPDSAKDAQSWTQGLALVLKTGPSTYRGRKYEDIGLSPEDGPKAGQIIQFRAKQQPERYKVDGIEVMSIADDAFYQVVDPSRIADISFKL